MTLKRFLSWTIPYLATYFLLIHLFDPQGFFAVLGAVAIAWFVGNVVEEIVND